MDVNIVEPYVIPVVMPSAPSTNVNTGVASTVVVVPTPGPPGIGEGAAWWAGEGPPTTVIGSKAGDYYIDKLTGMFYELS